MAEKIVNELPFKDVPGLDFVPFGTNERVENRVEGTMGVKAPIDDLETEDLISHMLDTEVTIKLGTILKASKGVRETLRRLLTSKKMNKEHKIISTLASMDDQQVNYWTRYAADHEFDDIVDIKSLPEPTFCITERASEKLPAGSAVMSDPVLQYFAGCAEGARPAPVFVAQESHSLRTVYPVINGKTTEESILDGGSQIVSMAKEAATRLGLSWDPEVVIHMQSANSQIEKSLGLARNVPFRFDGITVYLQVHVINEPAYKVLLGRPFDVVTCSNYQNDSKGGQLVTLTCPNTSSKIVLPTHEKGKAPAILKKPTEASLVQDFPLSRIWWTTGEI